jgi:hypothetical protein
MTTLDLQRRFAAKCCALTMLQVASMLLAAGAQAQANPCDQLKGVLAARIDASGVRGYTLETVPAGTPVPSDAKAIGTCEAGASKILYRRWGATRPSSDVPDAARPATASAPSPTPRPVSRSNGAASAVAAPGHEPERTPRGNASEVEAVRAVDRAVAQPVQIPLDKSAVAKVPLARQASEFMAEHWRWIGALVFLLIAGSIWVWQARRSAYDEAGLPRGPKL